MFASSNSLPGPASSNCTGVAVCIAHGGIAETKTVRAAAVAGLNHMFVQLLQALLEELDQRPSPTAWFQNPQACGARLSERKQMVT